MQYSDRETLYRKLVTLEGNISKTLEDWFIIEYEDVQSKLSSEKRRKLEFEQWLLKTFIRRHRSGFTSRITNIDNQMLNWELSYKDWLRALIEFNLTNEEN